MAALSKDAIARVLGPVSDSLAAELASTGASELELARAYAWLSNDEALMNDMRHLPSACVAELIEILEQLHLPEPGKV